MQFMKQNLNLKANPILHILIYYKHIFILRYNFFEHLKNIYREYLQKCQNHKNCWELRTVQTPPNDNHTRIVSGCWSCLLGMADSHVGEDTRHGGRVDPLLFQWVLVHVAGAVGVPVPLLRCQLRLLGAHGRQQFFLKTGTTHGRVWNGPIKSSHITKTPHQLALKSQAQCTVRSGMVPSNHHT